MSSSMSVHSTLVSGLLAPTCPATMFLPHGVATCAAAPCSFTPVSISVDPAATTTVATEGPPALTISPDARKANKQGFSESDYDRIAVWFIPQRTSRWLPLKVKWVRGYMLFPTQGNVNGEALFESYPSSRQRPTVFKSPDICTVFFESFYDYHRYIARLEELDIDVTGFERGPSDPPPECVNWGAPLRRPRHPHIGDDER
jgi:hypothetical protein